jgi:cytochrome b6-f complex iron-sulfur subunit
MHEEEPEQKKNCNRRQAFVKLGLGSLGIAGGGAAVFAYQFLSPNVLYEPSPITTLGKPEHFPQGSVTSDPKAGIYIVHGPEGFYALSAVCTHLGCLTSWAPELNQIACPCHGSKFNLQGIKVDGPAPRPLAWLHMWISEEGELMVDRATPVPTGRFLRT